MKKYLVKIKFIPNNIKKKFNEKLCKNFKVVGYKEISKSYMIPIIQFPNKKRMWLLQEEIL
uniref:cytochrome b6-f complex subunit PetP n=1 Tax=Lophurella stichidiosa TaxID=2008659 RepID=UPI0025520BAD|nr:cytochrome b6-f complex subunit PetP [Aphanocladia stichidiosa]WGH14063.1 cytochrome b6-f complex subunit PetP [Aphanocladia stichidiosa]